MLKRGGRTVNAFQHLEGRSRRLQEKQEEETKKKTRSATSPVNTHPVNSKNSSEARDKQAKQFAKAHSAAGTKNDSSNSTFCFPTIYTSSVKKLKYYL